MEIILVYTKLYTLVMPFVIILAKRRSNHLIALICEPVCSTSNWRNDLENVKEHYNVFNEKEL